MLKIASTRNFWSAGKVCTNGYLPLTKAVLGFQAQLQFTVIKNLILIFTNPVFYRTKYYYDYLCGASKIERVKYVQRILPKHGLVIACSL